MDIFKKSSKRLASPRGTTVTGSALPSMSKARVIKRFSGTSYLVLLARRASLRRLLITLSHMMIIVGSTVSPNDLKGMALTPHYWTAVVRT